MKEWNEKIAGLCSEQIFKLITSPSYFTSQKTDARMLIRMAGGISDEEIADDNEAFQGIAQTHYRKVSHSCEVAQEETYQG